MRTAIILVLCFFFFFSCSESDRDNRKKEQLAKMSLALSIEEVIERAIKYKIELLSLKYNIPSENFKQEFIAYIKSHDSSIRMGEALEQNQKDTDNLLEIIMEFGKLDVDKLTTISERHNIPMNTIACILYDYEIWKSVENCGNQ